MVIYKTTNLINGKIYIGQDSNNNPYYKGSGVLLSKALKRYGGKNFKKEILAWCYSKEHLDFLEKFYIEYFNSKIPNGYNISDGGEGMIGEDNPNFGKPGYWLGKKRPKMTGSNNPMANPEIREKTRLAIIESQNRPEVSSKKSISVAKLWKENQEFREKNSGPNHWLFNKHRTKEEREKISIRTKEGMRKKKEERNA